MKQLIAFFTLVMTFACIGQSNQAFAQGRNTSRLPTLQNSVNINKKAAIRYNTKSDCLTGKLAAQADITNGTPKYYQFGRVNRLSTFPQLMQSMYGIEVINMGCVIQDQWKCYNEVILQNNINQAGQNPVQVVNATIAANQNPTY